MDPARRTKIYEQTSRLLRAAVGARIAYSIVIIKPPDRQFHA